MKNQRQTRFIAVLAGAALLNFLASSSAQLTVTNNLQLWLKADAGVQTTGSSVTNWLDQSGLGNHASPDAVANRPTLVSSAQNGLPVVRFDGSDDRVRAADAPNLDGGPGMTIFVVARHLSLAGAQGYVVKWDYGQSGSYSFERMTTGNFRSFVVDSLGDGGNNFRDSIGATVPPGFGVFDEVYDGTQALNANRIRFFQNDATFATTGGGTITNTLRDSTSPVTIGDFPNLNRHFNGDIGEVLLYNAALNEPDRNAVNQYLYSKWSIPEPGAVALLAFGGILLLWLRRSVKRGA